jgi:protoporphyrinogen oxidase
VRVVTGRRAVGIESVAGGRLRVRFKNGQEADYDRVIATVPNPVCMDLLPPQSNGLREALGRIEYLSLVCVTVLLKRALSPYYVTNLTDYGLPFTGVIEATNLISREDVGGHALVYLPRYTTFDDPVLKDPNDVVRDRFLDGLGRIFPDLSQNDVVEAAVHREGLVQPIQTIGHSGKISPVGTPVRGLFVLNNAMIKNATLNNNQVVRMARQIVPRLLEHEPG